MKVLIVNDVYLGENNGTNIACMNLYRHLKSVGDEVRILCADETKKGDPDFYVVPTKNYGHLVNSIVKANNVVLALPVKKIIEKAIDGVDIIHCMVPFCLANIARKIAREKGIPITMATHVQAENFTAHLHLMNWKIANKHAYLRYYHKFYSKADNIHFPTQFIKDTIQENVKKTLDGEIISNGVNSQMVKKEIDRQPPFDKYFNILNIGRHSAEKAQYLLVKAVAKSKHKKDIQIVFAGQGPKTNSLMKKAKKYKLNTPVLGFYNREKLVDVINQCDLYVHTSKMEIEALACMEAFTCGLVPIIHNAPKSATKDFSLDELNTFKYKDIKDLANKIDYWFEHPTERAEASKKYLDYAKRFNQEEMMKKMRLFLVNTINKYKAHERNKN